MVNLEQFYSYAGWITLYEEENLGLLRPVSLSRMNAIFKYENNSI